MTKSLAVTAVTVLLLICLIVLPAIVQSTLSLSIFTSALLMSVLLATTELALTVAIIGGFSFDLFSAFPFGTYTISFVVGVIAIRQLFLTRLTNRSLLAFLALVAVGLSVTQVTAVLLSMIARSFTSTALTLRFDQLWLKNFVWTILIGLVAALLTFMTVRLTAKKYTTLTEREF